MALPSILQDRLRLPWIAALHEIQPAGHVIDALTRQCQQARQSTRPRIATGARA